MRFARARRISFRSRGTTRSCWRIYARRLGGIARKKNWYNFENIVGKSEPMLRMFDLVAQVAPSRSTVLIQGESGTGKELIAKALHANSPRRDKPFVPVNTGAMPSELLESTLFGHVKGAFTSAVASKKGLFEVANGGTLFLDEI